MTRLILVLAGCLAITTTAFAASQASSDKILTLLYQAQAKLANEGNVASMFLVGTMYEEGTGVDQDTNLALMWYKRAEEAGHPEAASRIRQLTSKDGAAAGGRKSAGKSEPARTRKPSIEEQLEQERDAAERARKEAERLKAEAARVQQLEEQLARQKQEAETARRQAEKARQSEEQLAKERAIESERVRLQAEKARLLEEQLQRERAEAERVRQEAEKARLASESARGAAGAAAPARSDQTAKSEQNANGEFKANPCDTPAARFMSTCH